MRSECSAASRRPSARASRRMSAMRSRSASEARKSPSAVGLASEGAVGAGRASSGAVRGAVCGGVERLSNCESSTRPPYTDAIDRDYPELPPTPLPLRVPFRLGRPLQVAWGALAEGRRLPRGRGSLAWGGAPRGRGGGALRVAAPPPRARGECLCIRRRPVFYGCGVPLHGAAPNQGRGELRGQPATGRWFRIQTPRGWACGPGAPPSWLVAQFPAPLKTRRRPP